MRPASLACESRSGMDLSFASPRTAGHVRRKNHDEAMARLRCASFVAVVQAANLWNGDHTARRQRRDRTWKRCILVKPEVRSCSRVVGDVLVQRAAKAGCRQHDDVIEALASDRSDESFDVSVLPWRAQAPLRLPVCRWYSHDRTHDHDHGGDIEVFHPTGRRRETVAQSKRP